MHGPADGIEKIAIVFCSHDRTCAGFTYDYGHLIGHFTGSGGWVPEVGKHYAIALNWCQTSLLAEGRQRLVEDCRAKGADKILWLDADMRFPKEALHMLLRHGQPVVGCNYVSRRPPYRFTAARDGEYVITRPGDTGLLAVDHLGFGCLLTDVSIFWDDGPWFAFDWYYDEDERKWKQVGEDVFLFRELRKNGHEIYIDQELSAMIGHIGEFTFTADEMVQVDEMASADEMAAESA